MSEQMKKEFNQWLDSLSYDELEDVDEGTARKAWQASRQSLVVKLPNYFVTDWGEVYDADDLKEALDDAGVKYE